MIPLSRCFPVVGTVIPLNLVGQFPMAGNYCLPQLEFLSMHLSSKVKWREACIIYGNTLLVH